MFPRCPTKREEEIAKHTCRKYSGRVGRSAFAKRLDEEAVRLVVLAHIRHRETNYDNLLGGGSPRYEARSDVRAHVEQISESWQ